MAVDTTTVAYHKLIKPGVGIQASTGDVESVLGTSSGDLATVCESPYINRWARYKPVIRNLIDTTGQLNSDKTWKTGDSDGATWWKATAQNCGITVSVFDDLVAMVKDWHARTNYPWQQYWTYAPPTGGASSPYRLTDFNYYLHKSTLGEDNDKPFSGWSVGGDAREIHRYQTDGVYYTDGQAQLYIRPSNPYLLDIGDISIPSGAGLASFRDAYFGVAAIKSSQSTSDDYWMSAITASWTFNENVTVPNDEDHPAGSDLRFTPLFQDEFLRANLNQNFLFFPFLCTDQISPTSGNFTSATQWGVKTSITGAKFIPLPFYPIEVTLLPQQPTVKITARFGAVTASASGISAQVTYTAENLLESGTPTWTDDKVQVLFDIFQDGQSPPVRNDSNYVPASTSFSDSFPKTCTVTYSLAGATSGDNFIMLTLQSSDAAILVGSGDNINT